MKKKNLVLMLVGLLGMGVTTLSGCDQSPKVDPEQKEEEPVDELAADRAAAKETINGYVSDITVYSESNQTVVNQAKETALSAVDAATSKEFIEAAVSGYKTAVDAVKTIAQELCDYKESKKTELGSYLNKSLYSEANKLVIDEKVSAGCVAIDSASDVAGVDSAVASAKAALDAIKTIAQEQLEAAIAAAKLEIEGYITDLSLYSDANKTVIAGIISEAEDQLDAATDVDLVDEIVANAKDDLDDVLTIAEENQKMATDFLALIHDNNTATNPVVSNDVVKIDTKQAGVNGYFEVGTQNDGSSIFDAYIKVFYNSTTWDNYDISFKCWDSSNGLNMSIRDDKITFNRIDWADGRKVTPLAINPTGMKHGQEYHLQILTRGWTKAVLIDGVCLFKFGDNEFNAGKMIFSSWEAGCELRLPKYLSLTDAEFDETEYNSKEGIWADCALKTLAELLEEAKVAACEEIEEYVDLADYSVENQTVISSLIDETKVAINAAADEEAVATALAEGKTAIDAVPTTAQEEFAEAIADAKEELDGYIKDLSVYSDAGKASIAAIITAAKADLDKVTDPADIEGIVTAAKADLDDVLTIAEEEAKVATDFAALIHDNNEASTPVTEGSVVKINTKTANLNGYFEVGAQGDGASSFDTFIKINYNSTTWDSYDISFKCWDSSNGLNMSIRNDKITFNEITYSGGRVVTPISVIPFGLQNGQEYHLQILTRGWTKAVLLDGTCLFKFSSSAHSNGKMIFSSWEAGCEMRLPVYKTYTDAEFDASEYNSDKGLWAPVAYKTLAEQLADAKTAACKEIEEYVVLSNYSESNQEVVSGLIDEAKVAINAATNEEGVETALADGKAAIDEVPTLEDDALAEAKDTAKGLLDTYVADLSVYSTYGKSVVAAEISNGKSAIDKATSESGVDEAVAAAKDAIDAVKTKAQEEAAIGTFKTNASWAEEEGSSYFSVDDGMIKMTSGVDNTGSRVKFGSQGSGAKYFRAYIKAAQNNADWATFSLCFNCWDFNSGYELTFKQNTGKAYRVGWSDGRTETEIEETSIPGLPNTSEHLIEVICHGWQKAVFLDGVQIFQISEGSSTCGHFFISTWNEHSYQIRDPQLIEYASEAAMAEDPQVNNRWWKA